MNDVLMVSFYFPPFAGIEVMRALKWCKYLPDSGWRPLVLCTAAAGEADMRTAADMNGLTVVRTPRPRLLSPALSGEYKPKRGLPIWLKRLLQTSLLFPDRYRGWIREGKRLIPELMQTRPHVRAVVATGYPWSAFLLAEEIARAYGVPLICDLRDAWTLNPARVWNTGRHRRRERRIFQKSSRVVLATRSMRDEYAALYPELADRFEVIRNGYDPDVRPPPLLVANPRLRLVYTGTFNGHDAPPADSAQSPYYLLLALRQLLAERPRLAEELEVVFAGKTTARELVRELGLEGIVTFLGHRPQDETLALQSGADALLLFVAPANRHVLTGKVFEYVATGRPILAMIPAGTELEELLGEYGNAARAESRDAEGIAGIIRELLEQHRTEGSVRFGDVNELFVQSVSRSGQAAQLARLLEDACHDEPLPV